MRRKKRKTTEKEIRHQRRHDSLHCRGEMQQVLTKTLMKPNKEKQSVSTLKGKVKFFRFKIFKYKT